MKYRIVKSKSPHMKPRFKPQYKSFIFWENLSENEYTKTIFNSLKWDGKYLNTKEDCIKAIEEHQRFSISKSSYTYIHKYN